MERLIASLVSFVCRLPLDAKATPEPWGHGEGVCGPYIDYQANKPEWEVNHSGRDTVWLGGGVNESDRDFIAHARTDVPALVAEVERLAAENARLRAEVDSLRSDLSAARAALDGEREALAVICDEQASLAKRDRCHAEAGTLHQIAVMIRARRAAEAKPKEPPHA